MGLKLKDREYNDNVSFFKIVGTDKKGYEGIVVTCRKVKNALVEVPAQQNFINDEKLENNIIRARGKILELAKCNDWDFFVTLTLNGQLFSRYDLNTFHYKLTQTIKDINRKYGCHIKFLLIPEKHLNGAWHMHGLMADVPAEELRYFKNERYNLKFCDKFGFSSIEKIKDPVAVDYYITKYICKDISMSVDIKGACLYYRSRNLNEANVIFQGNIYEDIEYDTKNQFCSKKCYKDNIDDFINLYKSVVDK